MISYLKGTPIIHRDYLTIIVANVGYKVFAGSRLLAAAGSSSEVEAFIYTHVKEDALDLYGFSNQQQLSIFELVLSVSGVGPKTALALADAPASQIVSGVQNAEISYFTEFPRVGKKLAQKIIIELTSKLGSVQELDLTPLSKQEQDFVDALISLGFSESESRKELNIIDLSTTSLEEGIKQAIQHLSQ